MGQALTRTVVRSRNRIANHCVAGSGIVADGDVGRTSDYRIFGIGNGHGKAAGSSVTSRISYRVGLSAATYGEGRSATLSSSLCCGGTGTVVATTWRSVTDYCGAVAGIVAHHDVGRTSDHGIFGIVNGYGEAAGSSITSRVSHRVALSAGTYGEGGATA